ncbi:MAG: hypothetical protein JKX87_02015 [Cycloclasticus sp.]|nr:hypothetical protein [Cycloclasticus sp.]
MEAYGLTKANVETKCPYCGDERSKSATRQYRCKACGETIYIKRTLDNSQKRLMTYDEASTAQEETDTFYNESVQKNNLLRQYATVESMTTSTMVSAMNHPDANHFKIRSGHHTCAVCQKLVGKIFQVNKHNIKNMPVPNERCLSALNDGYYCGTYLETVFDDQLTTEDCNEVILEYSDYIDVQPEKTFLPQIKPKKTPYATSGNDKVDFEKLNEIKRQEALQSKRNKPVIKNKSALNKMILANIIIWPLLLIFYLSSGSSKPPIDTLKNNTEAAEISAYMKRNFAVPGYTASWYIDIDEIRISQTDTKRYIDVLTVLDRTEKSKAKNLCGAISSYWNDHKNDFSGIRIIGTGEEIVVYRYSFGGNCN